MGLDLRMRRVAFLCYWKLPLIVDDVVLPVMGDFCTACNEFFPLQDDYSGHNICLHMKAVKVRVTGADWSRSLFAILVRSW